MSVSIGLRRPAFKPILLGRSSQLNLVPERRMFLSKINCPSYTRHSLVTIPKRDFRKSKITENKQNKKEFILSRRETERGQRRLEKSRFRRIQMRTSSIFRDYKEVAMNIRNGEITLMLWKIKEFLFRNFKSLKLLLKHAWMEIKKIGKGFRALSSDIKYSIKTTKDESMKEYGSYSFTSRVKIRQTWKDLFKFIPFSIFLIIPGLELLLPAWLIIFPNAIPSQFQSEAAKAQKLDELVKIQRKSAEKLSKIFPQRCTE